MLLMALAFWMYSIAVALARLRSIMLERESTAGVGAPCSGIARADFFAMGGYAPYVWGCFGLCALALVAEPLSCAAGAARSSATAPPPRPPSAARPDAVETNR